MSERVCRCKMGWPEYCDVHRSWAADPDAPTVEEYEARVLALHAMAKASIDRWQKERYAWIYKSMDHHNRADWFQSVAAAAMRQGLAECRRLRGMLKRKATT